MMLALAVDPAPLLARQVYSPLSSLLRFFRWRMELLAFPIVPLFCNNKYLETLLQSVTLTHLACPLHTGPGGPLGHADQLRVLPLPLLHPGALGHDGGGDDDIDHVHVLDRVLVGGPLNHAVIATLEMQEIYQTRLITMRAQTNYY